MNFNISDIHETSVKILEEIGIFIGSTKALEIFDSLGCKIIKKSKTVKICSSIINNALSHNYPFKKIYDRSGNKEIELAGNNVAFASGAAHIKIRKYDGNFVSPVLKDLVNLTKIHDYFENIDICWNAVDPSDIPFRGYRTKIAAEVFKNTTKPCAFVANDPQVVEEIYDMALAIRGSRKSLFEKPLFTIGAASEAVLGYKDTECDLLIKCAELGIPTGVGHYPIMGFTAPLNISGALSLANANWLAAHVLKTAVSAENPSHYSVMAGIFDMRNSNIATSSPEIWLYYLLGIKLGKYYNLPVSVFISSDSKGVDLQMAYEKALSYFICISAGANRIDGATCMLDNMTLASYEQVVIDNEMISGISYYFKNFCINNPLKDFDNIKNSLNNKMYFLESNDTLQNYKKNNWNAELFIKNNFVEWEKIGMPKVIDLANKKVQKVLKEHIVPDLPKDALKTIDGIVLEARSR